MLICTVLSLPYIFHFVAENVALCVCVCVDIATLIVDTEDMHSRATILKCIPLIQMCLAFIGMSGNDVIF